MNYQQFKSDRDIQRQARTNAFKRNLKRDSLAISIIIAAISIVFFIGIAKPFH